MRRSELVETPQASIAVPPGDRANDPIRYGVDDRPPFQILAFNTLQLLIVVALPLVYPVLVLRRGGLSLDAILGVLPWGLFALAIGTLLQAVRRGPVGSGYLCPPLSSAIYLHPSVTAIGVGGPSLVWGMTVFAGACETVFSALIRRLRFLFPPEVCGLIVLLVGVQIGQVGVNELWAPANPAAYPAWHGPAVAGLTLAVLLGMVVWGNLYIRNIAPIVAVALGVLLAGWLTPLPAGHGAFAQTTAWVDLPHRPWWGWSFQAEMALPFLAVGIAAALRTVGVVMTLERTSKRGWRQPDYNNIGDGVRADGIGSAISGILGFVGTSSAPSAIGVAMASGVMSRVVSFTLAAALVVLAFVPKVLAYLVIAPAEVIAALLLFYSAFMIVGGLRLIGQQPIDVRGTFVLGISLTLAVASLVAGGRIAVTPVWIEAVAQSPLTVGILTALVLNLWFRIGVRRQRSFPLVINDRAPIELSTRLSSIAKELGAEEQVIQEAAAVAAEVIKQIRYHSLNRGDVEARVRFDGLDLVVSLSYEGRALRLQPNAVPHREDLVEENFFTLGLESYMQGVYPADTSTHVHGDRVRLDLAFVNR